jgi:hypothetical protein
MSVGSIFNSNWDVASIDRSLDSLRSNHYLSERYQENFDFISPHHVPSVALVVRRNCVRPAGKFYRSSVRNSIEIEENEICSLPILQTLADNNALEVADNLL